MARLLLIGVLLIGGYAALNGGRLPQMSGAGPGGKLLAGGSAAGTVAGGVVGAARRFGN